MKTNKGFIFFLNNFSFNAMSILITGRYEIAPIKIIYKYNYSAMSILPYCVEVHYFFIKINNIFCVVSILNSNKWLQCYTHSN